MELWDRIGSNKEEKMKLKVDKDREKVIEIRKRDGEEEGKNRSWKRKEEV